MDALGCPHLSVRSRFVFYCCLFSQSHHPYSQIHVVSYGSFSLFLFLALVLSSLTFATGPLISITVESFSVLLYCRHSSINAFFTVAQYYFILLKIITVVLHCIYTATVSCDVRSLLLEQRLAIRVLLSHSSTILYNCLK